MNKVEKLASLKAYIRNHEDRLSQPVPEFRKSHEESYRDYLRLEIKKATKTVEKLAMEIGSAK